MTAERFIPRYYPESSKLLHDSPFQRLLLTLFRWYYHGIHQFEIKMHDEAPRSGPALYAMNHSSLLDVPAAALVDPYGPSTRLVVKQEMYSNPLLWPFFKAWRALPVARDGSGLSVIREIDNIYKEGRTICIAAEGTRSDDGHLGPMDETFVRLALRTAGKGVPVVPFVIYGSFEALPRGKFIPRKHPIRAVIGAPMDLTPWTGKRRLSDEEKIEVATYMRMQLADLLPPENQPLPDSPPMWNKREYVPRHK